MTKLLIEILQEDLDHLPKDTYVVFAEMSGISPEMKMLYAERSQMIKDLGILNKKISALWTDRE